MSDVLHTAIIAAAIVMSLVLVVFPLLREAWVVIRALDLSADGGGWVGDFGAAGGADGCGDGGGGCG